MSDRAPMSRRHWRVVAPMTGLDARGGFDVRSISRVAPGLAQAHGAIR